MILPNAFQTLYNLKAKGFYAEEGNPGPRLLERMVLREVSEAW